MITYYNKPLPLYSNEELDEILHAITNDKARVIRAEETVRKEIKFRKYINPDYC